MKGWFTFFFVFCLSFFLSSFLSFLSSLRVGRGAGWLDGVGNIGVIGRGQVVVLLYFIFLEWFDGVGIVGVDTTEGGF
jgi:hypothetical protein